MPLHHNGCTSVARTNRDRDRSPPANAGGTWLALVCLSAVETANASAEPMLKTMTSSRLFTARPPCLAPPLP